MNNIKKIKRIQIMLFLWVSLSVNAQKSIIPSDEFKIEGRIKKELKFTLTDLGAYDAKPINDVLITSHLGEPKGTSKKLKGILFKQILDKIEFDVEGPKQLSEFFLTFVAGDGYKIVFSWNEIFNTETGNNIYIITEKEGKKIQEIEDRILMISTTDFKTGRRNLKGLTKIIVNRVD